MKAGQVIAKQSFPRWYQFHLRLIYWGIYRYQRMKWGVNWKAVHVFLVLPHAGSLALFEQTWPIAKWTSPDCLQGKTYAVCEWKCGQLDIDCLAREAEYQVGNLYDLGDLLDFAVSGFAFNAFRRIHRIFGDKAGRSLVCSTMVARILQRCGCFAIERPTTVDPAYFENDRNWRIVERYVKGNNVLNRD